MQKFTFLLFGWTLLFGCASVQAPPKASLQWMTLQEAKEKLKEQPRLILMDIYTDWCYWCKVMDKSTYTNKELVAYVQDKFYAVKFNAEMKSSVEWNGQQFKYNEAYHVNELSLSLTQGQLSFPTTVIITPDNQAQFLSGYLKPSELEPILKFFGEGAYKTQSFEVFRKQFKSTWR